MSRDSWSAADEQFRPLSPREQRILFRVLEVDFPGCAELLVQTRDALARQIDPDGSLTLVPSRGSEEALVIDRVPVEAEVEDLDGVTVHILLHVVGGFLNELEVFREDSARVQGSLEPAKFRVLHS